MDSSPYKHAISRKDNLKVPEEPKIWNLAKQTRSPYAANVHIYSEYYLVRDVRPFTIEIHSCQKLLIS